MAKILLIHGMRLQHFGESALRARWRQALVRGLRETAWGRTNPGHVPTGADIELVYWADLFRPPRRSKPALATKGRRLDDLRACYYAFLRGMVRFADRTSSWSRNGKPRSPMALLVNHMVHQSALYMNNGPVLKPDPGVPEGAFFQIQARFHAALQSDTRIVIGHSLGTVIAYEGLCLNPHRVDTFITIGSPIATPRLILRPLREHLHRFLNHPCELPLPWPGVRQWLNFFAPADVWSVPVKRLAPFFGGGRTRAGAQVRDIQVVHGNPHDFVATHKLTTYLKHAEILEEIGRALEHARTSHPSDPRPCAQLAIES